MQKSSVISTESLCEIKAPLATFDTIDLGDEDIFLHRKHLMSSAPQINKITVSSESATDSTSASESNKDYETADADKKTEEKRRRSKDSKSSKGIDDVDFGLSKNKRSKSTNVKYEKIEDVTDDSPEQENKNSSFLSLNKSSNRDSESETESSDSDSGYIRSGYISASKGVVVKNISGRIKLSKFPVDKKEYSSSAGSTPTNSPKPSRTGVTPSQVDDLLTNISKRKAYEKRLQRLQVKTTPVERPRSTTPINVFGLEEYAQINSPEKSQDSSSFEKLKITLPPDEYSSRSRSPRRSVKVDHKEHPVVFDFDEELLFTHTRSAIVVQNDSPTCQSPKRVLIPPTLSPAVSPVRSPRIQRSSLVGLPRPTPRLLFDPKTSVALEESPDSLSSPKSIGQNWERFDENSGNDNKISTSFGSAVDSGRETLLSSDEVDSSFFGDTSKKPPNFPTSENISIPSKNNSNGSDIHVEEDEVLTVSIDDQICDINIAPVSEVIPVKGDLNNRSTDPTNESHDQNNGSSVEKFASSTNNAASSNNDTDTLHLEKHISSDLRTSFHGHDVNYVENGNFSSHAEEDCNSGQEADCEENCGMMESTHL